MLTIFLIPLLLLSGCGSEQKVSIYQSVNDSEKESEVKEMLEQSEDIEQANVIFIDEELFVALQVKPWKKFKKKKIENKWQKKLEEQYSNLQVLVSSDFKLFWETTKLLEEEDRQKVTEKIDVLKKLAKEET
ncbi:YhcN/YlaJ family sporulation lipoprotein [Solibacillus sp. FSL H8-0538]|uniref:YhcN/YlaJ family sporulation lipoprotein n=1 Tax=Solibacillus sp. FSL H8-0538 TaxID=2921400 RepID=UPI0030FA2648